MKPAKETSFVAWRRFAMQCARFLSAEQLAEASKAAGMELFVCEPTKHVCGLHGFGRGLDGINDTCSACTESFQRASECRP